MYGAVSATPRRLGVLKPAAVGILSGDGRPAWLGPARVHPDAGVVEGLVA